MEVALQTFSNLQKPGGRKIVVLGDMLELALFGEGMHRGVGMYVAVCKFDLFVAIGRQMAFAAEVAEAAGIKVRRFPDTRKPAKGYDLSSRRAIKSFSRVRTAWPWSPCWMSSARPARSRPRTPDCKGTVVCSICSTTGSPITIGSVGFNPKGFSIA